ncbi:MAG: transcriptional regulator [Spirochaetes bacterium GWF1_51_8]|nr:MAG: transcriptional regulator [Spirochaetes bacterium GWF1_51_8]
MKKVEAVIRPSSLQRIKTELSSLGIHGITVLEAGGYARQRGHKELYKGKEYDAELIPKLMIMLVTKDDMVGKIVEKISEVCYSGEIGDGKIFISPIEDVYRIRTKENGEQAL